MISVDGKLGMGNDSWIFLRGLSRGQGHWGLFPSLFRQKFPQAQVEFLDLPGCGTRHRETSCLTIQENLDKVRESSQWVREKREFSILAISLGGMVATLWQDLFPNEVRRTFLINTSFEKMPPWKRFNPRQLNNLVRIATSKTARDLEEAVTRMVCSNEENRQKNLPHLIDFSEKHPVNKLNILRQLFAASKVQFPPRNRKPAFLLASRGDQLVSFECTEQLAQMWGAPAAYHPWAGHDLPIDDPEWVLSEIEKSS